MTVHSDTSGVTLPFDNSYARLPERFYAAQPPTPVAAPHLIKLNQSLAEQLQLDPQWLRSEEGLGMLAGNSVPQGAHPLAMAYAGHQFGGWAPQLGDGRALLIGELLDQTGDRFDIQLKGSGRTPFSRMGDGRAWIGPVLREYIVSEAMHAMGVPTTRALAAVGTGESVYRESVVPGAVLTRVAQSHVRVGTFEYFVARGDIEALRLLTDYVVQRHYPSHNSGPSSALQLLEAVIRRQGELVAHWQSFGFIHGVMNTDNSSIVGDTIDYGPCAFIDTYHPAKVFSSIDQQGRYSYQNQPRIAQWNMAVLAQALLPLMQEQLGIDDEEAVVAHAQSAVDAYSDLYADAYLRRMRPKLGLQTEHNGDLDLVTDLLQVMADQQADFTHVFRSLSHRQVQAKEGADDDFIKLFTEPAAIGPWLTRWRERLSLEADDARASQTIMQSVNPVYIPRNHRVEGVILAAVNDDFEPLEKLTSALSQPFVERSAYQSYADAPTSDELVHQTFCGT